jgi:aminopeptidase YwaD
MEISNRRVGSQGNRQATDFFAEVVKNYGFKTEIPQFECMDWRHGDAHLLVDGERFEAIPSPYSLGCQVRGKLVAASNVSELEGIEVGNNVLLLHGEITQEQLMPKNFTFYNPEHHQHIVRLLETKEPLAIVTATGRNPGLAGGLYPFPLIEDGDFDLPSVYMKDVIGDRLLEHVGKGVALKSEAERIPGMGCNVIAQRGEGEAKVVVCAHIDAKIDTPGAIDNGGGTVILLLLAELLADYDGDLGVEIVAFNGEDYYSAAGQVHYLQTNQETFDQIMLAINIDGAGYIEGNTAYSLYECPDEIAAATHQAFSGYADIQEGEQWYQSDHMIFVQGGRPAMAITSDQFEWLSTYVTHTEKDTSDIVDGKRLANVALGLRDLVWELGRIIS